MYININTLSYKVYRYEGHFRNNDAYFFLIKKTPLKIKKILLSSLRLGSHGRHLNGRQRRCVKFNGELRLSHER